MNARRKPKPPGLPMPKEADILRQILEYLQMMGIEAHRQNTGAGRNPAGQMVQFGVPGGGDVQGQLKDGRHLEVEVKRPGRKPSPTQLDRLRRVNELGGVGLWVDDVAQLMAALPKILGGARVEIDAEGRQWVTDEPEEPRP